MAIVLLAIFTALLVLATVLPWVPWPHGIVRVCEFPRVQIAALAGILLILTVLVGPGGSPELTLVGLQFAVMGVQASSRCEPRPGRVRPSEPSTSRNGIRNRA